MEAIHRITVKSRTYFSEIVSQPNESGRAVLYAGDVKFANTFIKVKSSGG